MRLPGAILIAVGFVIFLGNFSGAIRFYPGIGILIVIIGGIIFSLGERFETPPPGNEE